jgi:DNA mismatch repair protein MLH1
LEKSGAMSAKEPGIIRKLDETVVNRIAAGEVIQRPANALKELMENSLDASSSNITVVISGGGLQLLQINDNGTGIRKEDLEIVCERFTTSKLRNFNDLSSIATYGFRGEALASISHVAKLTILTKTKGQQCGYKVEYSDGKPVNDKPKPCAANQGTQISVEDLFYNVPTRRRVLKSASDEFNRIADVVSKYAIHNSGKVGFTLKKVGDTGNDLRTQSGATVQDNVASIYGPSIAKELIEFEKTDTSLKFKAKGFMTNVNYNVKKFNFLLFINHRLVESTALKRSIEMVYGSYLPKGTHPFVYMSLEISPENVDVNVHPTKHEVHFLHQDEIIEKLQQAVDARLLGSNSSRTFYTQPILPGASLPPLQFKDGDKTIDNKTSKNTEAPKNMIRTDSREQKLEKFFTSYNDMSSNETAKTVFDSPKTKLGPKTIEEPMDTSAPTDATTKTVVTKDDSMTITKPGDNTSARREIKLASVKQLNNLVDEACHPGLRGLISEHTFVGCADREFALVQHATKLYVVNIPELTRIFFYQMMLKEFGNAAMIALNPPSRIKSMARLALDQPETGWTEADGTKDDLAQGVEELLVEKADMLNDYFSFEINDDGELCSIPLILDGYVPDLNQVPMLVLRLATEVNWDSEETCFDTFCQEISKFYCASKDSESNYDVKQHSENDDQAGKDKWKIVMEHTVFPAMKKYLKPPKQCADNRTFNLAADLPDLYKVFERC